MDWYRAEPCSSGHLQISTSLRGLTSLFVATEDLPPGSAFGDFFLDLPSDELFVRPVPRRGNRPFLPGVRVVYGLLSGCDLRADLPDARHACTISIGRPSAVGQLPTWPRPHCDGRTDDAVGPVARTRHPEQSRDQRWIRSSHSLELSGCPLPGVWIRIAAFLRFCRVLAYRNRRRQDSRLHRAGEFRAALCVCDSVDLLDALAHVIVLLDSRLRFPS